MRAPKIVRPIFPKGYVDNPKRLLGWREIENKIKKSKHYWVCSVRPDHRPHAVPKWGIFLNGNIYFDGSPATRHARNIATNPNVVIHLENGERAVIIEGSAREITPDRELSTLVARAYTEKYSTSGYSPQPTTWDAGGLYQVEVRNVIAWNNFTDDPTKFIF